MKEIKGNYNAPEAKNTLVQPSFTSTDSAGVESGLSARSDLETESLDNVKYNNDVNSATGNSRQVPKPYKGKSVKEKGKSFEIL